MNQADTAWMLMSTALVLLMTPALAFFYGGLVRSKNVLNTMMMSFVSLGVVGVLWALVGLLPGVLRARARWLGDLSFAGLNGVGPGGQGHDSARAVHGLPGHLRHHHRGADLGRHRRAHALLGLRRLHLAVGAGGLQPGGALGVGRRLAGAVGRAGLRRRHGRARQRRPPRRSWRRWWWASGPATASRPSCRTTSPSSCWARACCGSAGSASTPAAPWPRARRRAWRSSPPCWPRRRRWSCGAMLDAFRTGKPTAVGCATAIVVGLVAITPAAGLISPMNALLLGAIAAVPSYVALVVRAKTSLDDSLDVVAAHGVGGTVGAMLTGVFAEKSLNGLADGALYGNPGQLLVQGAAVLATMLYSGLVSFVLLKAHFAGGLAACRHGRRGRGHRHQRPRRGGVHADGRVGGNRVSDGRAGLHAGAVAGARRGCDRVIRQGSRSDRARGGERTEERRHARVVHTSCGGPPVGVARSSGDGRVPSSRVI